MVLESKWPHWGSVFVGDLWANYCVFSLKFKKKNFGGPNVDCGLLSPQDLQSDSEKILPNFNQLPTQSETF